MFASLFALGEPIQIRVVNQFLMNNLLGIIHLVCAQNIWEN